MVRLDVRTLQSFVTQPDNLTLPVVRLPDSLLPAKLRGTGVVLQAILGFYTPTLNIKYIPASWMLKSMLAGPQSKAPYMLVENSSGNFALSLAACARTQGLEVTAIVSDNIAAGKLPPLRASGVRIIRESEAVARLKLKSSCGGARMAELLAVKEGWINLGQYSNKTNPESYSRILAPELLRTSAGQIAVFGAALGSTGTMVGLGGALRKAIPELRTVAAIPHLGQDIPGCRDDRRLAEVRFDWRPLVDHICYVSAADAFRASLGLWNVGIPAGPSSGAALLAMHDFLISEKRKRRLHGYSSVDGSVYSMLVFADTLYPYFEQAKGYCSEQFQNQTLDDNFTQSTLIPELIG